MQNDSKNISRKEQAKKTKKKILSVTAALIHKKGYQDATIADICKKAHISIGTFYYYYPSKEAAFRDAFTDSDANFNNNAAKLLIHDSAIDNLITYFCYYAEYITGLGLDTARQLYYPYEQFFSIRPHMFRLIDSVIEEGQKNGQIKTDVALIDLRNFLFRVTWGTVYSWCVFGGQDDLVELMRFDISSVCQLFKA